MSHANLARMIIGGTEYTGWQDVTITRSLDQVCSTFSFASTLKDPNTKKPFPLHIEADCKIYLDDDLVLTGQIDDMTPSRNPRGFSIPVSGRSLTSAIVDCSVLTLSSYRGSYVNAWADLDGKPTSVVKARGWQFKKQKIETIAEFLCAPYGLKVACEVDSGSVIKKHTIEVGETPHDSLDKLCRLRGLLMSDDEQGRLILTRASDKRAGDSMIAGENIKEISCSLKAAGRYSHYYVIGQAAGADTTYGAATSQYHGAAFDDGVRRFRPLVMLAEAEANHLRCEQRAAWEAATRAGKSIEITISVAGWRKRDGELWRPNRLAYVGDPQMGLDNDFLITEVAFKKSRSEGTTTELKLSPALGYAWLPPIDATTRNWNAANSGMWKELNGGKARTP